MKEYRIIGSVHMFFGGWVLASSVMALTFSGAVATPYLMLAFAVMALVSVAQLIGGQKLSEGQWRGALMLAIADGLLLAAKLAVAAMTRRPNWELLLIVAMLGSVIWIWPTLTRPEAKE